MMQKVAIAVAWVVVILSAILTLSLMILGIVNIWEAIF